jgi:predicted CoA-substrate-specific enzyme activase
MDVTVGVDIGSVSIKIVVLESSSRIIAARYLPSHGEPLEGLRTGFREIFEETGALVPEVTGLCVTGSGRELGGIFLEAGMVRNEITCHAAGAVHANPGVRTIMEIGGQDSKIIFLQDSMVCDFSMNTICAAGTGAFIEHQCRRLGITLDEFSSRASLSSNPVSIAGRCTVFAESDMIYKSQQGYSQADILQGLCDALVRNYIGTLAKNRELQEPVFFQGGVAGNRAICNAFRRMLGKEVLVPEGYQIMGAIGAALLAAKGGGKKKRPLSPRGFRCLESDFTMDSFTCSDCENQCDIVRFKSRGRVRAYGAHVCGKWKSRGSPRHGFPEGKRETGAKDQIRAEKE